MRLRKIHISNSKSRNTLINYKGHSVESEGIKVDEKGNVLVHKKIIKGTSKNSIEGLKQQYGDNLGDIANALIQGNPEIDLEITGRFLGESPKVYVNDDLQVVYRVNKIEKIFDPNGTLKEKRALRELEANIAEDEPLRWSGKYFLIEAYYNKFVFIRTYQLFHDSGLTYDFLYGMAKELEEKKSFLLLGSGKKGKGPAIFQDGGRPFRVFLEGRTQGEDYLLLMHISNLELKQLH